MNLKCASFFAGVGGIDKGFEKAGFETIYANEMDKNASITYKANYKNVHLDVCDIRDLNEKKDIPAFDIMLAGFPCQAFSVAGYRQGFDDEKGRGNLFFELVRIIKAKKPKILFLENVKNLVSHDDGKTFAIISNTLEDLGYHVKPMVLNASSYGNIPQTRERIYIVCFKSVTQYRKFDFPKPIKLEMTLKSVIDFDTEQDQRYYYTEKCSFYNELRDSMKSSDTCYQWRRVYVRENKSNLCPTLTANMGTGGHNVPLILTHDDRIRKLTPRECFNLQGFPDDFILPETLCNGALYKQAGNSVVVSVIERIANEIKKAIE
ncbi:DNA cytosine methyltransferase [Clostridium algidicarnis]|uniref:DNA cytosine methyltransferase n=1 Tax=Clostridium algidicarnis TaxID=37659 RepID=UPI001C0ABA17|nr:DNA cytosine methyltransferase [Clostridium algidicarnis]MBU3196522.1 DNA cytosine methyltransferase [Clostridium algidicarnis]MCB2287799.1 DNA cytosine methyltransferase [Clostridium algidicarnis]